MPDPKRENLFANLPAHLPDELCSVLAENRQIRIEKIVSAGHSRPKDFWYDQDEDEWVVVLMGESKLAFENAEVMFLKPGDHVLIPAHQRHRVEWTIPDEPTVWLAVFFKG